MLVLGDYENPASFDHNLQRQTRFDRFVVRKSGGETLINERDENLSGMNLLYRLIPSWPPLVAI